MRCAQPGRCQYLGLRCVSLVSPLVGGEAAATTRRNAFGIPGRLDRPDLRAQRTSGNWTDNGFSISFEHDLSYHSLYFYWTIFPTTYVFKLSYFYASHLRSFFQNLRVIF